MAQRLLSWFDLHGRKDLPWQSPRTSYRVWVSEIMLQQTQVTTAIPYFERFMDRFDNLVSLAEADEDEVLHYWSGLGYYARCRNLHKSARIMTEQGRSELPDTVEALEALPGIGRSTAAAIVAQVWNKPEAILDGNVKRVLSRYQCVVGWTGSSAVQKTLWKLAAQYTPNERVADYTQAIMDLGATVCKRSKPACGICPLNSDCLAFKDDRIGELPTPKKKKALPEKRSLFIVVKNNQQLLLQKRPPAGIWGGLWSLPESEMDTNVIEFCRNELGLQVVEQEELPVIKHSFSHYHLYITPVLVQCEAVSGKIMEQKEWCWYHKDQSDALGLPAPVSAIIDSLSESE